MRLDSFLYTLNFLLIAGFLASLAGDHLALSGLATNSKGKGSRVISPPFHSLPWRIFLRYGGTAWQGG